MKVVDSSGYDARTADSGDHVRIGIGSNHIVDLFSVVSRVLAAQTDPGMYQVLLQYFQDIQAAGVNGFSVTYLVDPASIYGEWGMMDYIGEPASLTPKYDALLTFIDSPGNINLPNWPSDIALGGAAKNFTVTVYNSNGTVDTGYVGTVSFTSSDPDASLPTQYTFQASDKGYAYVFYHIRYRG